jgi:MFS family permease
MAAIGNFLFFTNLSAFFLLPLHLKQLGATDGQLGLVMGLYSATAIFVQPAIGAWVDRGGRRPFMLGGAALAALAALLFALAPRALLLFPLLRILQGLAYSMFFIANFAVIVDLVPADRRGQAFGIFGISGLTSTAVGPALGEVVVRAYGFPVFFAVVAGIGVAALVVAARLDAPPGRRAAGREGLAGLVQGLLTAPRLPMALAFSFGLGLGVVFTFLPTYAAELGVGRIGLFTLAYAAGALLVRTTGSQLIDRAGRRAVIIPALGLQALGGLLLAAVGPLAGRGVPPVPLLAVTGFLAGAAHGFLYPALTALVMDVTPEDRRGRMIGVFSAFTLAGSALGAMAFGHLAHGLGYPAMFAVLTVCLGGACGLAFRLER